MNAICEHVHAFTLTPWRSGQQRCCEHGHGKAEARLLFCPSCDRLIVETMSTRGVTRTLEYDGHTASLPPTD